MRLIGFAATFWEAQFGPLSRADRVTVRRVKRLVQAQAARRTAGVAAAASGWCRLRAWDMAAEVTGRAVRALLITCNAQPVIYAHAVTLRPDCFASAQ